jgi:DNA polymerase
MDKQQQLTQVSREINKCTRCNLYKNTTHPVPGEGDPNAKVMFIGEGPGFWEDKQGRPFVGQAGKLLDELLQAIELPRKDVFIGNVIKHRPPNNRDPLPEEIKACEPFLDKQMKIINPKIIVTLGRFSMAKFLPGQYISQIHGQPRFINFAGKKRIIIPMYHPAAALRSSIIMEEIKKDFQKIIQFLERKENVFQTKN